MDEKAQLDQLMYQEQVNVVELKEIMTYFEESGLGDDYNMTIESKDTVDTRTLSNYRSMARAWLGLPTDRLYHLSSLPLAFLCSLSVGGTAFSNGRNGREQHALHTVYSITLSSQ